EVWDRLEENYVDQDKISEKEMFYGALQGLVASLGDPYTIFMDPKVSKEFDDDLSGTFEGIGAEIGMKDDILTVIAPLPETPAEKAGIKAGDKIFAINGESAAGLSVSQAVEKIRGPHDTEVILTIVHNGFSKPEDIKIMRSVIVVKSIKTELRKDGIFVITVTSFNDDTKELFDKAVLEAFQSNPKGVILDLRNNPGGYLDTAIEMASEWVEDGTIVSEKYSDDNKIEHSSRGRAMLKDIKTVALVNQGSASASEIVAGALQDYGKATIIGRQTYGKGSVQSLINLEDGSSLKVTIAKWLTPKGRSINDEGVAPDYDVDFSNEDYEADLDPQMDAAVSFIDGKDISKMLMTDEEKKEEDNN
ncbi:MAG: S41 family peptidase, partial [Candidatus Magasanikbacteria bacterium]|nr:S41 family peptidase [Candidatus Magasanikbacteria bacterium]